MLFSLCFDMHYLCVIVVLSVRSDPLCALCEGILHVSPSWLSTLCCSRSLVLTSAIISALPLTAGHCMLWQQPQLRWMCVCVCARSCLCRCLCQNLHRQCQPSYHTSHRVGGSSGTIQEQQLSSGAGEMWVKCNEWKLWDETPIHTF